MTMSIPHCDPAETITQVDLDKAYQQNLVLKIRYFYTGEGSFLKFTLANNPEQEFFLSTRRERTRPKVFVDQNLLLADLHRRFPGLVFEANGQQMTPPGPAGLAGEPAANS